MGLAAALGLAALASLRVRLVVVLDWRAPGGARQAEAVLRLGPWSRRFRFGRRAEARGAARLGGLSSARIVRDLLDRAQLESLEVDAEVGLGDAARTAVAAGAWAALLWNAAGALAWHVRAKGRRAVPQPFAVRVAPDFGQRPTARLRLRCIWSLSLGDLTLVGARAAARALVRRRSPA